MNAARAQGKESISSRSSSARSRDAGRGHDAHAPDAHEPRRERGEVLRAEAKSRSRPSVVQARTADAASSSVRDTGSASTRRRASGSSRRSLRPTVDLAPLRRLGRRSRGGSWKPSEDDRLRERGGEHVYLPYRLAKGAGTPQAAGRKACVVSAHGPTRSPGRAPSSRKLDEGLPSWLVIEATSFDVAVVDGALPPPISRSCRSASTSEESWSSRAAAASPAGGRPGADLPVRAPLEAALSRSRPAPRTEWSSVACRKVPPGTCALISRGQPGESGGRAVHPRGPVRGGDRGRRPARARHAGRGGVRHRAHGLPDAEARWVRS